MRQSLSSSDSGESDRRPSSPPPGQGHVTPRSPSGTVTPFHPLYPHRVVNPEAQVKLAEITLSQITFREGILRPKENPVFLQTSRVNPLSNTILRLNKMSSPFYFFKFQNTETFSYNSDGVSRIKGCWTTPSSKISRKTFVTGVGISAVTSPAKGSGWSPGPRCFVSEDPCVPSPPPGHK